MVIGTGLPALDRLLPRGAVARGSLVEWLDDRAGGGSESLAVRFTREVGRSYGDIVVLDRDRQFYPPAFAAWGVGFDRLVIIHPGNEADELWAAHQALRCPAVSVVWLRRDRLRPHDFRRLSLAAEAGGTVGVLFRSMKVRGQPTWADVQLCVQPRPFLQGRRLCIEVTRCRGHLNHSMVEVELDDVTGSVREVDRYETVRVPASAALAHPAADRRAARMAWTAHPRAPA
jgi:hypothetical protein